MAKSKGHVSPPASERGNYPFPVREQQQMIANYGGAFSGAEICQGGLILWQLHIYFYHVFFPQWSFVACFFLFTGSCTE